jgi:hypothetical protein
MRGKRSLVCLDTLEWTVPILTALSFEVVRSCIIGGWMIGTRDI